MRKYIDMGKTSGLYADTTSDGYMIYRTTFVKTNEQVAIMEKEIFGHVVNINTFKTEAEVLEKANDTEFGLYLTVYNRNINRTLRIAKRSEAGTVVVNYSSPTQGKGMLFGGYKDSGVCREGTTVCFDNFLETTSVLVKLGEF
ncbi:unnamed protein product [Fusarium venenatum]|uniref:Aldehyde dehydrogenase domain-containing protein n=1 Tax=Fusarium venenatum TaxID=56646 RepID=A0A2L2TD64_9HYPO|nr:uncharacterized protein FVRRES_07976 [Fusarium venenatum]CEI67899.1 unnamed protein product [Fusarium venenatum]